MGDVNVRHERWGGDGVVENVEGRRIVLGARTPRQDLQGKVTLPWRIRTSKEKDNTPLQPRR